MTPKQMIGRKILNRYQIIEKIGSGGMGVVWKADDLVLDRSVALKVLRSELSEDDDFVWRFRREARAAASLSHSNIVSVYDVGEDQGLHFFVMELVEGQTLRDKLNKEKKLEYKTALEIAEQISLGLAHAHNNGIIHRDIKPENILLTESSQVKVADFGIARALGAVSHTSTDIVVGSASYLSPEQAKNGLVSAQSDLYSLGVVLYEMLVGKPPFAGDSPVAVALQHLEASPPPISDMLPTIPHEIDVLILKALAKKPNDRFQSANEMLKSLQTCKSLLYKTEQNIPVKGEKVVGRRGKSRRSPSTAVKMLAVFIIVGVSISAYAVYAFYKWMAVPIVEVPDIVGLSHIQAQTEIRNKGLIPRLSAEKYDREHPAGTVISQSPLGGEKVKLDREIYYTLSKGEAYVEVPDLRRRGLREAQLELENQQLQMGNVDKVSDSTVPKDQVISQNPREGALVSIGTRVDLVISKGSEPETVIVPLLVGLLDQQVLDILQDNLLDLGDVTPIWGDQPIGTVIDQEPENGEEVPVRTKINVTISSGSDADVSFSTLMIQVPEQENPVHVRLAVWDVDGETVYYNRNEEPGNRVTVPFRYRGDVAVVKVYFDGDLAQEEIFKS